jgi:hypothetical protein
LRRLQSQYSSLGLETWTLANFYKSYKINQLKIGFSLCSTQQNQGVKSSQGQFSPESSRDLQGAEQGAKRAAAAGLELEGCAAVRARRMRVEKGVNLLLQEVSLEGAEKLFADSTGFSGKNLTS